MKQTATPAGTVPATPKPSKLSLAITSFDTLPDSALVNGVTARFVTGGRHRVTVHRNIKAGLFPTPVKSGRMSYWRVADLRAYLNGLAPGAGGEGQDSPGASA